MGSAGRYSDRYFGADDGQQVGTTAAVTPADGEDVLAVGTAAGSPTPPWRGRVWGAVAVMAAAATVFVAVTNDDTPAPVPPSQPVAEEIASRAGIETVAIVATVATSRLWDTRGYTYDVDLTNESPYEFDLLDVTSTNAGTELIWNEPLTLPASGSAHLRVDFLVINCAAVAVAPAPADLRLTVRRHGTTDAPGVATVSVSGAGQTVDDSTAPLCPAQPSGQPPLVIAPG